MNKSYLERTYSLQDLIVPGKVLVLYGARRVGKTTLLRELLSGNRLKYRLESGDNMRTQEILSSMDFDKIREFAEGYELIAIDEAQQVPEIGMGLKILVDMFPDLYVVATGSSSFDLSQSVGEPLTGRKRTLVLYSFSQAELNKEYNRSELRELLNDFLVFGCYPEVLKAGSKKEKRRLLEDLVQSYLLKDILQLERIKAPVQLMNLLKLLAFQIGSEVSWNELSQKTGLDVKTVGRYIDLLEKGFVITRLSGFSRNLRNEITSKAKYYFLDNGIRNGVISRFHAIADRDDAGALFENFIVMERLKRSHYKETGSALYFWRTHTRQEIDLIEERNGKLKAFECKWNVKKTIKPPSLWKENYPGASFQVINRSNYLDYCL